MIRLLLTVAEAKELNSVAGNGYGDGEFYVDPDGGSTGRGGKREHAAFLRASKKLSDAIAKARGE